MHKDTCGFEGCEKQAAFVLTDVEANVTDIYCEQHFLVACASYLFAAAVHDVPEREQLLAMHDGLYTVPKGVKIG